MSSSIAASLTSTYCLTNNGRANKSDAFLKYIVFDLHRTLVCIQDIEDTTMVGDVTIAFPTTKHVTLVDDSFRAPSQITATVRSSRHIYTDWIVVSASSSVSRILMSAMLSLLSKRPLIGIGGFGQEIRKGQSRLPATPAATGSY